MAADGSVILDVNMNVSDAEKELARLHKDIVKLESDLETKKSQKSIFSSQLEEAKKQYAELSHELRRFQGLSGAEYERNPEVARITGRMQELDTYIKRAETDIEKTTLEIDRMNTKLEATKETYDKIAGEADRTKDGMKNAAEGANDLADATNRAGGFLDKFTRRIVGLAKRVFVFSLITTALRKMRTWLWNVVKTNSEATEAIARLKGAFLTLAQPMLEVIIPAFTLLVNLLAKLTEMAAGIVSKLFGSTAAAAAEAAKSLYEEQDALKAVGSAAKEAIGSLAGFDEINTIQTENSSSSNTSGLGDTIAPDFSKIIMGELDGIVELFSGIALLALGAILTFSGANIPLGITLMALGAAFIVDAVSTNWNAIEQALSGPMGTTFALVSGAFLAIGAILAFSGINIPLGIALMAIGAAGMAAVAAVNWDTLSQVLQGPLGVLLAVVSAAILVIGALLLFSGVNIPLGLGLMAAGAIGLAETVAANWDTIVEALRGPLGTIVSFLSAAFLALGAILLFTGASIPLGLGLMLVGAAGLATTAAANWDTVQQYLEGPVGAITALISGAFLVVGAALLFSGVNIPLGLGLLVTGAVGLVASIAANWETIQNTLQGPIGTITALVGGALLVLGAILAFSGAMIPLGIGLMAAGAIGLATAIAANWDTITNAVGGAAAAITAIVSAALLVLGVILLFTGAGIPLGLGLIAVGAAGLATSIAPNWDFVLEKIRGAWNDLKTWWNTNISKFLSAEYWQNLGKDMIDGLLSGLKGIFSGLKSWASDVWDSITGSFSTNNAKSSISSSASRSVSAVNYDMLPNLSNVTIPRLAQGAVIPPNREFMAVLGDQKSGTNVEAPLKTIEQALENVLARTGGTGGGDIHITVELDGRVIARQTVKHINDMTRQAGKPVLLL